MVAASEMVNTIFVFYLFFIRCISPIEIFFSFISFIREKLFPVLRLSYCKSAGSLLLMENKSKMALREAITL